MAHISNAAPALAGRASIIISVYNVAPYLVQCLESAANQDYAEVEIIAVDDGSTDSSRALLGDFAASHRNVTVVSTPNQGPSAARNTGLRLATGEYVLFLDGDDYIEKNTVTLCVEKMKDHGVDMVFFAARSFCDGMAMPPGEFNYERLPELTGKPMRAEQFFILSRKYHNYLPSPCLYVYRRERFAGITFYPGILHEDNLFTTRLLLERRDAKVYCLSDQLFNRRLRPDSIMTQKKQPRHVEGYMEVALELSRLDVAREKSETGKSLNHFIQNMIRSGLAQWWIAYPPLLPLAQRKRLLRVLSCVNPRYIKPVCILICLFPELLLVGHRLKGALRREAYE
ncbi:MAG TPA: glycosyltransferase family 2 protein [Frateuria sp.]|uniref:glycosyltransferase family 2 protein n=1 Tax=Frateuria sp. TaxID=2211372 RepID=UPI002DEF98C8|nr:glycosyltransferase family 2 protein [Frateuria sp.]